MKTSNFKFLLLGSFIFFIFVVFSYFVHKDVFNNFDFDTTVRIQDHFSRRFDTLFSFLSLLGSFEIISLAVAVILVLRRRLSSLLIPFFYFLVHVFEIYGKVFVSHPGPPFLFFRYNIDFLFPSSYVQPGFSYPSGHSARTVFISTVLIFFIFKSNKIPKNLKIIMSGFVLLFDLLMLSSRVYLGEHWTTDVIGGSLLGLSLAIFSLAFFFGSKPWFLKLR